MEIVSKRITMSVGYGKIIRSIASQRADLARSTARRGESHARARARILRVEQEAARRLEHAALFGEES